MRVFDTVVIVRGAMEKPAIICSLVQCRPRRADGMFAREHLRLRNGYALPRFLRASVVAQLATLPVRQELICRVRHDARPAPAVASNVLFNFESTAHRPACPCLQVSQTYFMALSTVFLASLARLFVCNLHLGGRLLEVHGALLRTLVVRKN